MKLHVNGNDLEVEVTEQNLEHHLLSLPGGEEDSFLILSKDDYSYMQTSGSAKEGFILEYQEGDLAEHYTCTTMPLSTHQVVEAFKNYLKNSDAFKTDLKWEKEDFANESSGLGKIVLIIIALIFLGVAAIVLNS